MTVLALDPGETTGFALGRVIENHIKILEQGEIKSFHGLDSLIEQCRDCVFERFINRGPWLNTEPLEVIGVIKYLAGVHQIVLEMQAPEDRRFGMCRFSNIKFESHHGDALAHLLTYTYRKYGVRYAEA